MPWAAAFPEEGAGWGVRGRGTEAAPGVLLHLTRRPGGPLSAASEGVRQPGKGAGWGSGLGSGVPCTVS